MINYIALYTPGVSDIFMPRFERARKPKIRDSKFVKFEDRPKRDDLEDKPRRSYRGAFDGGPKRRPSFDDRPRGGSRGDFRGSRGRSNRRDFEKTQVTCSTCGKECEVPFKPTSSKPVYCSDCFGKKDKGGSGRNPNGPSSRDLDLINEKLNKIMKALNIE